MDYVLDIIIPKKEATNVELNEKLIEWGGYVYPCEPPQYITDSNIIFEQIEDMAYFSKIVEEGFKDDIIALTLKSEMLHDLEYAINNDESKLEQNVLFIFLHKLFILSEFYIFLVREDEKVKERYEVVTKEEMNIRLFESLKWSNPKDVLLFKKRKFTIFQ